MGNFPLECGGQVFRDWHQGATGGEIANVQIGLIEGPGHLDEQPAPVGGEAHPRPVFLLCRTIHQRVIGGIGSQPVQVDRAVVVLLARGDLVRRGIAGVIEGACIRQPGQRRGAHMGDSVGEVPASFQVEKMEHTLLAAVLRQAISQQQAIFARIIPVESGRACFV